MTSMVATTFAQNWRLALHHTVQHCTTLHHKIIAVVLTWQPALHHTAPHCTTLHHSAPNCTTLHHTAPQYYYRCPYLAPSFAPHCTTLHQTIVAIALTSLPGGQHRTTLKNHIIEVALTRRPVLSKTKYMVLFLQPNMNIVCAFSITRYVCCVSHFLYIYIYRYILYTYTYVDIYCVCLFYN